MQVLPFAMVGEANIAHSGVDGTIAYNLMQNDMVALRAVMRLGWEIPNPVNGLEKDKAKRFPFAAITA